MSKLIVAIDNLTPLEWGRIMLSLKDDVWGFKLNDLLYHHSCNWIRSLKDNGVRIFADPKIHDIPNTITNVVSRFSRVGTHMLTVHASCGVRGMQAAVQAAGDTKIIAVTA